MKTLILILALSILYGNVDGGTLELDYSLEDSSIAPKSKVVFYRNGNFGGSFIKYHLCDKDTIGFIEPGTFILKEYGPGLHSFIAPELWKDTVYFRFKNGENYVFEFVPSTLYTIKLPKMMKLRTGEEVKKIFNKDKFFRISFLKAGLNMANFAK